MDTVKLYSKGSRVWLTDKEEVWKGGVVVSYSPDDHIVVVDPETEKELRISLKDNKSAMPPLRNPDILTMENNLTTMSYLHEPAVLHSLHQRFTISNNIYTYCGIVLVAINPYCDVHLYGNEMIWAYKGQQIGQLDPHIYAISEDAYSEMKTLGRNQSIIVSGESGAGKTVSAKYAMRYFATVAGNEQETAIERRILSTNPIMEALGNAKTIRNDNSSRFGKYVELEFDKQQNIAGAHICTYLLEKSRVVFQAANERNYHIFYQLCAVRDIPEMKHLHLRHPDDFRFTRQGNAPEIDNVDDSETFYEMSEGLFNLGITEEQQLFLFSVLAAILHMGNIQFIEERNDSCSISNTDEHLLIAAKLLGLEVPQLQKWLCHKTLKARNETVVMSLKQKDAFAGMEAFVKHIYASLFLWVVKLLNAALSNGKKDAINFIGILDIYGFEMFEENSFEQFCINYANEKLQQQFNQHVFKLEQAEYIKEQIKWSFIDFTDNQPCIDLIEKKMGIIDLLDEQCRMNRGTDENWVQILYKELTDSVHFKKPKTGNDQFVIVHYADKVSYLCHGFIAKNLDAVNESHINLLKTSSFTFFTDVLNAKLDLEKRNARKLSLANEALGGSDIGNITSPKRVATKTITRRGTTQTLNKTRTVGAQFKTSLNLLMDALSTTVPHFIRCIKPNDDKEPFGFVPTRVVQQLRACGVIETVRISAAGYPSRWSYKEFESRYSLLVHSSRIRKGQTVDNCRVVLSSLVNDKDKYQFGKTKIFFRAGQVAYFEKLRSERQFQACVMMQARVRSWLLAKRYRTVRAATISVQCVVRGMLARRRVKRMREHRASVMIQKHVRGWVQRVKYQRLQISALFVQCRYRAQVAYKEFLRIKYEHNARIIQKHVRGWLARCAYKKHVIKIIKIQSCVRRHLAKKKLKALKFGEQKSESDSSSEVQTARCDLSYNDKLDSYIKVFKDKQILLSQVSESSVGSDSDYYSEAVSRPSTRDQIVQTDLDLILPNLHGDVEARSIGHFKKLNVKLEKRIFEMQLKSKDMVTERNNLLEETKQNLEELAVVKKQLGDETRSREQLEKELSSTSEELKEIRHNYLELKLEVARRTREEEDIEELKARIRELEAEVKQAKEETESEKNQGQERYNELERSMNDQIDVEREHHQKMLIENSNLQRQLQELQELTHGQWQDSSDDRDDMSSVMSDVPPDSGVLSSGIASPAVGIASPAVGGQDTRARIADLENIREKLEAELESANKDKRYRDQAAQATVLAKESPVQCTVDTTDNTSQYSRITQSDAATQASRVRHHVATQHYPEARDNHTDTCYLVDSDMMDASDDSAIDVDSNHGVSFSDISVQYDQETVSRESQIKPDTQDIYSQAEIPDPELPALKDQISELPALRDQISELETQRQDVDKMLSHFYIPVQYSDFSPDVDLIRNYLNNIISVEGTRGVALHPGDEKLTDDNGYLTAANNSPVSVIRRSADTACNEEGEETDNFSSFEIESMSHNSDRINEELRVKLDLAYKTIAELKEAGAPTSPIVVNGGDKIFPVDDNERKRLEEIIIENVELKENLDKMTDELMDAIDEQTLMRTKYEQMELKLANVKESLLREIINTRNPRQAQDKIRSHLDSLRVELFSDVAKFNKHNIKTEEDAALQSKVETLAGENIKLLDDINRLQNAIPFISEDTPTTRETMVDHKNDFFIAYGSSLIRAEGGNAVPEKKLTRQDTLSTIRQRKQEFRGMFACKKSDDSKLVKRLITQLKTEHVTGPGCMSGLTAHIMFMCVRYADHCNDEGRIQELLTAIISGITSVTRKQSRDPVISTFWLTNCLTLLHDLTQFSGEELYHNRLSPAMRDFALKNYDLSDYRPLLSDQCVNIYHTIVKTAQDELQPMLIPGMLEHDSIPGMNTSFSGGRKLADKGYDTGMIVNRLQFYLQLLNSQNISINIVRQFIGQLLYFINATLLNNLILRKDLCHWSKGIQIRYNLSQVEQWVREQGLDLDDSGVLTSLSEIRQASQLLQMNKSSVDNAAAIVETCFALNTMQLQKLLMLYSPSSEFEERVPQEVIKYILNHKPIETGTKLMMDPNKLHALKFSYETKDIDFTMVTLPSGLKLDFLEKY